MPFLKPINAQAKMNFVQSPKEKLFQNTEQYSGLYATNLNMPDALTAACIQFEGFIESLNTAFGISTRHKGALNVAVPELNELVRQINSVFQLLSDATTTKNVNKSDLDVEIRNLQQKLQDTLPALMGGHPVRNALLVGLFILVVANVLIFGINLTVAHLMGQTWFALMEMNFLLWPEVVAGVLTIGAVIGLSKLFNYNSVVSQKLDESIESFK